jgi:integrase
LQVLPTKLQVYRRRSFSQIFRHCAFMCLFSAYRVAMPLLEVLYPGSAVPGVRWHKPSRNYIAEIGYHKISHVAADGSITTTRIRTTHYLGDGDSRVEAEAKFAAIKDDWNRCVAEQRTSYDQENAQRRAQGLPLLPRFKPVWPKETMRRESATPTTVQPATHRLPTTLPAPKPILELTIRAARDRYVAELRKRIGLQNGKGINKNTFEKTLQSLDLGLALNKRYARNRRPIDVDMRLGELALADYETFVQFWCDPQIITSPRTGQNYIGAFRQMLTRLKVPRPEGFDEVFSLKVPKTRKIARYDPEVLKPLLNCKNERARLFAMMCLNLGAYAIDIVRLRFDHITDAEGRPTDNGHYITKPREKTSHQNDFSVTHWLWPETKVLMERYRARPNPFGTYFLSKQGAPYHTKTVSGLIEEVIRDNGLTGQFSVKQFRKVGASQIKALAGSDAMHQYKSNALSSADAPYILEDYSILTKALQKFREKLIADGVLIPVG